MWEWEPRIEKLNLAARQYGAGVSAGVGHVALSARMNHETGMWIIQTDASNAFNPVLREPMRLHASAYGVHGQVL